MVRIISFIVAILIIVGIGIWFFGRSASESSVAVKEITNAIASSTAPVADGSKVVETSNTINSKQKNMRATLHTNKGDVTIEFSTTDTPKTVENFIKLAKSGFYDGTKFHRVIKNFMIQGGDPLTKDDSRSSEWGTGGPGYKFADEIGVNFGTNNHNNIGTIAMANSGPNTNGSQFFINVANNNFLDTKHTVFGRIVLGMDVVRQIENTQTGTSDRPTQPIIITSVTLD